MNIGNTIVEKLSLNQDKIFLIDDETDLTISQFIKLVKYRVADLRQKEIKSGNRVLVDSNQGNEFWINIVAVWILNAIVIPFDSKSVEIDLAFIEKLAPDFLLGESKLLSQLTSIRQIPHGTIVSNELNDLEDSVEINETAAILLTSGSSGAPRGVTLTHFALLQNCLHTLNKISLPSEAKLLIAIPKNFTSAICHFLAASLSNCTLVSTQKKLFGNDLYQHILKNKITAFGGSPLQLQWIAECTTHEDKLNWFMSSGDHLSIDTINKIKNIYPHADLITVYGLTELAGRFCVLPSQLINQYPGSVGQPLDCLKITIRDENGNQVGPNVIGDIYAEGETVFANYYNDLVYTSSIKTKYGLKTGDVGYLNENNILYLCGRSDDVFKVSGQKVSANKIREALSHLNIFLDFAVLPFNDSVLGCVPYVYYVPNDACPKNPAILLGHLRKNLNSIYLPRKFIPVSEIPRTGSGKIKRKLLIEKWSKDMLESGLIN